MTGRGRKRKRLGKADVKRHRTVNLDRAKRVSLENESTNRYCATISDHNKGGEGLDEEDTKSHCTIIFEQTKEVDKKDAKSRCIIISDHNKEDKGLDEEDSKSHCTIASDHHKEDSGLDEEDAKIHCAIISNHNEGRKGLDKKEAKSHCEIILDHNKGGKGLNKNDAKSHCTIMPDHNKGGKSLDEKDAKSHRKPGSGKKGKGPGRGTAAVKRCCKNNGLNKQNSVNLALRRFSRRVGIEHIAFGSPEGYQRFNSIFLRNIIKNHAIAAELSVRKPVIDLDVVYPLLGRRRI